MAQQEREDPGTVIHRSLTRPILMLGAEREFVLLLGILSGIFILSIAKLWSVIAGVVIWLVGMFFLTRAGQTDPQLSKVGVRSLRYKRSYSADATPFAPRREVK